jgi:hypothetical protein
VDDFLLPQIQHHHLALHPGDALQLRLKKMRTESSREGEILITELLSSYKVCYFNMQNVLLRVILLLI